MIIPVVVAMHLIRLATMQDLPGERDSYGKYPEGYQITWREVLIKNGLLPRHEQSQALGVF